MASMDDFVPKLGAQRPGLPEGAVPELEDFCISLHTGFLGDIPLTRLPPYFSEWERIASKVPKHLKDKTLREEVDKMPLLDHKLLNTDGENQLAFSCLCFMGNGYVWQDGDQGVPKKVPSQLAIPWCALAEVFGCNPAMCYLAFPLRNWKLRNPLGPMSMENLDQILSFPGGDECRWFAVISLQSELEAVPGLKAVVECQKSVIRGYVEAVQECLDTIASSIEKMTTVVMRTREGLTPNVFYNEIRPYMAGWGGEGSALPDGLIYEGVNEEPRKVLGGSNAQMSTYAVFDVALGISHKGGGGRYLERMLDYMPRAHRDFIRAIRKGPSIRNFVLHCGEERPMLQKAFNRCVEGLVKFRSTHIKIATSYVVIPAKKSVANEIYPGLSRQGTGGTALIPFLRGVRETTKDSLILE